ncbi:MAG: transcriptional regulator [Thermodesulfobacteriota bacterium]
MGCGCKTGGLNDKQKEVLEAMDKCDGPCGSKDIAAATSLEAKQVSCQITALKKKGYVDSPVRCKYEITGDGKAALKA